MADESTFEGWVVLELFGHRRLAGYVREQEIAGHGFLRLEIPEANGHPAVTQFYAPTAVYGMTPTTEAIARAMAAANRPEPVHRWELPARTVEVPPPVDVDFPDTPPDDEEDESPI